MRWYCQMTCRSCSDGDLSAPSCSAAGELECRRHWTYKLADVVATLQLLLRQLSGKVKSGDLCTGIAYRRQHLLQLHQLNGGEPVFVGFL